MFATVILFGVKGKRRDWMMNWQFNWFGWSFQVAIVACIIHLATALMAGYQGSNKYARNQLNFEKKLFCILDVYTICMIMKELMKN
jgi:ABC-type glycerol-3-phosphate transport system permease component